MSQKKRLSKRLLLLIITVSVAIVIVSAILITNIFIPVKYLPAYINTSLDKPGKGEMRISFLDVGNGDCTVVELPDGKVALIDGGDGSYNDQLKIFKTLNSFGIDRINYLFCTSSAKKRCGGLAEIVKYKDIDKVFAPVYKNSDVSATYGNFINAVKNKGKSIAECVYGAGEYNEEYGYCVYALCPDRKTEESGNDVLSPSAMWISYGGISVLLLGDLQTSQIEKLLDKYNVTGFEIDGRRINLEDCNIVKIANGGSEKGSCALLYDLIRAEGAIISTYKEPSLAILSTISNYAGSNIYRTDKHGTVTLSISDGAYNIKKER